MEDDSLQKRGNALEAQFFSEVDRKLIEKLRADIAHKSARDRLKSTTGLADDAVLDELLALGINDESVSALSLFPLVWVAWADGSVDPAEKAAILKAASDNGIDSDSVAAHLLNEWIRRAPAEEVVQAWVDYIGALKAAAGEATFQRVKQTILQRAYEVADAAGGILGLGRVSSKERGVLRRLEQAFE
ncbi:MAG: TerB family tellurite resistance protein [Planctomycetaceae bacterium]|nr:TerB family tellurite resistance protein [Planctomycetaceae bacterium]